MRFRTARAGAVIALLIQLFLVACGNTKHPSGSLCFTDEVCGTGSLCLSGQCVQTKSCSTSLDCGTGICSQGHCFSEQCSADNPCRVGLQCVEGFCIRPASETQGTGTTGSEDASGDGTSSTEKQCTTNSDCVGKVGQLSSCEEPACVSGQCTKAKKPVGASCSDGLFCTVGDACNADGQCVGTPRSCGDLATQCTAGVCDESKRACIAQPKPQGTACDDGKFCTVNDRCDGQGTCKGGETNPCTSDNACLAGYCDTTSDSCKTKPQPATTPCDDGKFCTVSDHCDGKGLCVGGETRDCSASGDGVCMEGFCDPDADTCDARPVKEDTPCNDGLFCTVNDRCSADGKCEKSEPRNCVGSSDGKCVSDRCDEANKKCGELEPDTTACNDGNPCTKDTTCTAGVCGNGTPLKLGTPCSIGSNKNAMCGYYGDCRPWERTAYNAPPPPVQTSESESYFLGLCLSDKGDKVHALGGYYYYDPQNQNYVDKLNSYPISGTTIGDPKELVDVALYGWGDMACHGGLIGFDRQGGIDAIGTDVVTEIPIQPRITLGPNSPFWFFRWDESKGEFLLDNTYDAALTALLYGQGLDYANIERLVTISRLVTDTEERVYIGGQIYWEHDLGDGYEWGYNALILCTRPLAGGDPTCTLERQTHLDEFSTATLINAHVHSFFDNSDPQNTKVELFTLTSFGNNGECGPFGCAIVPTDLIGPIPPASPGYWMFGYTDASEWTIDGPNGCDGMQRYVPDQNDPLGYVEVPCWHPAGFYPNFSGRDFIPDGWRDSHGLGRDNLYVVGTSVYDYNQPLEHFYSPVLRYNRTDGWKKLPTIGDDAVKKLMGIDTLPYSLSVALNRVRELAGGFVLVQGEISLCNPNLQQEQSCGYNAPVTKQLFSAVYCTTALEWLPLVPMQASTQCCDRCNSGNFKPCSYFREGPLDEPPLKMESVVGTDMTSVYLVGNQPVEDPQSEGYGNQPYIFSWITKK